MAKLLGKTPLEKFKDLGKRKYAEQAKWFLNAFWSTGPSVGGTPECEQVWVYCQNMIKIDGDGAEGSELEEFDAHRFLEKNTKALTWTDMRAALKELDIDFDKKVSLSEFLVHHYKIDWKVLVNSTQAVGKEAMKAIRKAEEAVTEAKVKRDECVAALALAEENEQTAQTAEDEAVAAHNLQLEAEAEVKAILAKIQGYQDALASKAAKLQAIIDDESIGMVKKMKAKHELMDLKNGSRARRKGISSCNPELLRKAKIDQKAAVRKAKRATAKANAAKEEAEAARQAAQESKAKAVAAVERADVAMQKARDEVDKVKAAVKGAGEGTVWWMGRELEEQAKYLPRSALAKLKRKHKKKVAKMTAGATKEV